MLNSQNTFLSCQPNFLSETRYQHRERKMKLAIWNFSLHFLRSVLGIRRQRREFVSCLYQSAAVSAVPADFGPSHASSANPGAAGKGQDVYECVALLLFLPHGAQWGGTGRSVWAPQKTHLWLEAQGKQDLQSANKAAKWLSLKKYAYFHHFCNWKQSGGTGKHLVSGKTGALNGCWRLM